MPEPSSAATSPSICAAAELARRLSGLRERGMRAGALLEVLRASDPEQAAWLLDGLATAGRAGGPPFDVALLAAVDVCGSSRLSYDERRALFEAAARLGLQACQELLLSKTDDSATKGPRAPRSLRPGTRPLTLGERKSLARSWHRDVLERLIVDSHADVVAALLQNPHLTESDVLKIATARRASPRVLELILESSWACRPNVRRALVRNPRMPESTRLRLLGLLNHVELTDIASDPHLGDRLRHAVERRLRPPL